MEACIEIITSIEESSTECQIYISIFILPNLYNEIWIITEFHT